MIPRSEDYAVPNRCVHKNDPANCLLCGTKPIRERKPEPWRSTRIPRYIGPTCKRHNCANPCMQCYAEQWRDEWQEEQRQEYIARIAENQRLALDLVQQEEQEKAARRVAATLGVRCWHDRVALDCPDCHLADAMYDKEVYRRQINEALTNANLRVYRAEWKIEGGKFDTMTDFRERNFDDGSGKNDLVQVIDLAIWQATRHYGPEMNTALARTIAANTIASFQQRVIEQTSLLTNFYWSAMNADFRQTAEALFRLSGDTDDERFQRLQSMARNRRDEQWKLAQRMIVEYGQRRSRFESINETVEEDDGADFAVMGTSPAEFKIHERERVESQRAGEIDMKRHRPLLGAAVGRMRGAQRAVAQAILDGNFTVRDVPGVPKSTAARLRQVVLRIFREEIGKSRN